jgi:hypothetical protein
MMERRVGKVGSVRRIFNTVINLYPKGALPPGFLSASAVKKTLIRVSSIM